MRGSRAYGWPEVVATDGNVVVVIEETTNRYDYTCRTDM
jgi:hypothetical protein